MLWNAHTDPHAQTRTGMRMHTTRSRAHRSRGGNAHHHELKDHAHARTQPLHPPPPSSLLATCLHVSCRPELASRLTAWRHSRWLALQERKAARCAHVPVETAWTASVRRCQSLSAHASTAQLLEGRAALDCAALPRKGPRPSTGAGHGPSRESDCEPQFTVELGHGQMRLGRRLCRTRSQGAARGSNSQPEPSPRAQRTCG
jgi:hypothetical protein